MARARQPSPQTVSVLRALTADPAEWRYGYELGQQVGLKAGSLYPILIRLTERGLLEARWEEQSEAIRRAAASPPLPPDRQRPRARAAGRCALRGRCRARAALAARCGARDERAGALPRRDSPRRRLLPAARSQWGQRDAGRAGDHRRHRPSAGASPSAARAWPASAGAGRRVWQPLAVAAGAAAVIAGEIALAGIVGQTIPLLLVLALLAWLGRRPGYLGPVRPDRTARTVRAGGYLVVGAYLVALIAGDGGGFLQPNRANWGPVFTLMLTLFTVVFLALTARSSRLGSTALAAGVSSGLVGRRGGIRRDPVPGSGTSLADGLPGDGGWLLLVAFAAPAAAALADAGPPRRRRSAGRVRRSVPGRSPRSSSRCSASPRSSSSRARSTRCAPSCRPARVTPTCRPSRTSAPPTPTAGVLMLGAMLAAVLWVALRPLRGRASFGLLALLAVPPALFGVALVGSAPKAAAVTFAAAALTLAAAATIAASAPARSEATGSS